MDVLIFSTSIEGDRRRVARSIEARIRASHPDLEVETVDFFERFAPGLAVLGRFAYQQQPGFFPDGAGGLADLAQAAPEHPLVRELERSGLDLARDYLEESGPSTILSLHPAAALVAAELKGAPSYEPFCAVLIDDWALGSYWRHPATDHYFVASEDARSDLVVRGVPWGAVQVVGVPMPEAFDAPVAPRPAPSGTGAPVAGSRLDAPAQTARRFTALVRAESMAAVEVLECAGALRAAGLGVVTLADTGAAARRLEAVLSERGFEVARAMGRARERLEESDVVIQPAGGLGMAEAVAAGRPQILTGQAPAEEELDVDFLLDHGAALMATGASAAARKALFLATHPSRAAEIAAASEALAFPAAAKQVAERMASAAERSGRARV
jgi:UDP-N-acetylglucosamine:LPS N-acetylglucosamine transferase